jgi:hypothetical protein
VAYEYGAKEPEKLKIKDMTPTEKALLLESDTFCMMPWLHLHAFPDGRAYPCCFALDRVSCGRSKQRFYGNCVQWEDMRQMRSNMLANKSSPRSVPNVMIKRSQDSFHCV